MADRLYEVARPVCIVRLSANSAERERGGGNLGIVAPLEYLWFISASILNSLPERYFMGTISCYSSHEDLWFDGFIAPTTQRTRKVLSAASARSALSDEGGSPFSTNIGDEVFRPSAAATANLASYDPDEQFLAPGRQPYARWQARRIKKLICAGRHSPLPPEVMNLVATYCVDSFERALECHLDRIWTAALAGAPKRNVLTQRTQSGTIVLPPFELPRNDKERIISSTPGNETNTSTRLYLS